MVLDLSNRLAHRGPDGQRWLVEGPCGLAHNRLSIIDLEGGHQPMSTGDGGLTLVANGEIYNYRALRAELAGLGHQFSTHSDCEVILHAYAAWGMDALPKLHGMFAFALYDRHAGRLVLARDRLGIKPLYWTRLPGRILFGSEIKALLPQVPCPELAPETLAQYLGYGFGSGTATAVRGIQRVLPGQALVIERDLTAQATEYWSLSTLRGRRASYEALAEEFEPLMDTVMQEHLQADVPFGLFLSGGVDSSLMLALAARHYGERLRTFSVGFSDAARNELPDAEATARRFGTDHTSLMLDREALRDRFAHMVWAADDLVLDHAMLPTSLLAEAARHEVKVVITGEGGDEVFAGYGRYRKPLLLRTLRSWASPGTGAFRFRGAWPKAWAGQVYADGLYQARAAERASLGAAWQSAPRAWDWQTRCQYTDLRTELADALLPKVDRMLMAFGVEGRVPLLDHRVVEFGLALPGELKTAPHQGKLFLKRWARKFLPDGLLDQRKSGFTVPMGGLLDATLLGHLAQRLPRNPALLGHFKPAGIEWLIHKQRTEGGAAQHLWALVQIALWHRLFIEGGGTPPPVRSALLDWL